MSTIDSRIVTMKFDNSAFQKGVSSTLDVLAKLKAAVTSLSGTNGQLGGVDASKATSGLSQVGAAVDGIGSRFSAMSVIAVTALGTVTHAAVNAAGQMAKSLSIGPLMAGFDEYELKMGSIQTILANTSADGTNLQDVSKALGELNHYADKTIYNFGAMTKNIGLFTNAGLGLEESVAMIKGFSNEAASSGASAQAAAGAAQQLSQALNSGVVRAMDWFSITNAGMGSSIMREGLINIADAMGEFEGKSIDAAGASKNFKGSLEQEWLTAGVMSNYLRIQAGELNKEQIMGLGLSEQQATAMIKQQKIAEDAATKVRTFTGLLSTLREGIASGWSESFELIFGNFNTATDMWTDVSKELGDIFGGMSDRRNEMLKEWQKEGGRDAAIEAVANAWKALGNILGPMARAFREVFPAMTGTRLADITKAVRDFTETLIANKDTMDGLQSIFGAVFGVLGVGIEIVKGVVRYFATLIPLLFEGAGGGIELAGSLAGIVEQLTQWILKGDYIANFFDKVIAGRAALLGPIIRAFGDVLSVLAGWVSSGADVAIENIGAAIAYLEPYLANLGRYLEVVGGIIGGLVLEGLEALEPVLDSVVRGLQAAGRAVQDYLIDTFYDLLPVLSSIKDAILDALGSLSGIGGSVGGAFGGLGSMFDIGDSADKAADGIDRVKAALTGAGDSAAGGAKTGLAAFGEFLKGTAEVILKAGGAIIMGIGWLGSKIVEEVQGMFDGGQDVGTTIGEFISGLIGGVADALGGISFGEVIVALNTAMTAALGAGFVRVLWKLGNVFDGMHQIFGGVGQTFEQLQSNLKTMQNEVRADIIMKIAISLGILAAAVYVLSTIDGEKLGMSLGAVATMLMMVSAALIVLEKTMPDANSFKSAAQFAAISVVMLGLAASMLLMAIALRVISKLDPDEIKTGLLTLGGVLAGIIATTAILNKTGGAVSLIQASVAIGILAFALTAFAAALKLYSALDTGMLAEGGLKIAAIILGLGLAFRAFPATGAILAAAAMFIAANALVVMAGALKLMSLLDAGDSWQAILTLGGALLVLAVGANAMNGALMGAAAMMVMAAALAMFVPVLILLGSTDISTIAIGLGALAAAFLVFGVIGYAVGAGLAILGAGMLLLGAGMALAGLGMIAFGTGLSLLASSGAAAAAVLVSVINNFLEAIPGMMARFAVALISFAKVIEKSAPAYIRAGSAIISSFLRAVLKNIPLMGKVIRALLNEGLKTIRMLIPDFIKTGMAVLQALLSGLMANIGEMAVKGVTIAVRFIDGVTSRIDQLVAAGKRLVIALVKAIGTEIGNSASSLASDMRGMAGDMIDGLLGGLRALWGNVTGWLADQIANIPGPLRKIMGIASPSKVMAEMGRYISLGLAVGIRDGAPDVQKEAESMGKKTLEVLTMSMNDAANALQLDPHMSPVITPVLDLTQLANDAASIGTMMDTQPLQAELSYSAAAALAAEQEAAAEVAAESGGDGDVIFEQHLHSPTPLDRTTIYRSTRNQFSMAKEALKK